MVLIGPALLPEEVAPSADWPVSEGARQPAAAPLWLREPERCCSAPPAFFVPFYVRRPVSLQRWLPFCPRSTRPGDTAQLPRSCDSRHAVGPAGGEAPGRRSPVPGKSDRRADRSPPSIAVLHWHDRSRAPNWCTSRLRSTV